jgi:hypothetical protein
MAALAVFQRAIQKTGPLEPEKVRDAIAETNIMTAYGPVKFRTGRVPGGRQVRSAPRLRHTEDGHQS